MGPAEGTWRVASSVRKKRPARVLFAALLFIVVYFLLFPYPLGRELVARPRWAVPISLSSVHPPADSSLPSPQPVWQFQLGNRFGYVHGDGSLLYAGTVLYGVSMSAAGFVNYTRLGTDWIVQDSSGQRLTSYSGSGYPLLGPEGNRFFNVKSDLSGIIELDRTGGVLWEKDFPALVTSLAIQGNFLLVGFLNGSLLLINEQGSPLFEYSPAGSRIPLVAGTAMSPDGLLFAAVCGIGPQSLFLFGRQGAGYAVRAARGLPSEFRRELRMGFSPDSRFLFLEGVNSAGVFDPERQALRWVSLRGRLSGAAFPGHGRLAAFASRDGGRTQLAIERPQGGAVYREEFSARELSLQGIDGQLLLGWDGMLARIDLEDM
jgi:hypothetical protein